MRQNPFDGRVIQWKLQFIHECETCRGRRQSIIRAGSARRSAVHVHPRHISMKDVTTPLGAASTERDILLTLFDLGRQVASVIDLDELLERIPNLIGRLIHFDAFAIYLLDERRNVLRIAYAVGYPDTSKIRLSMNEGLIGRVVQAQQGIVVGDVATDPHYIEVVPGMSSTLAVPL